MPYDGPEPDDPQILVGVGVAGEPNSPGAMVAAFAEEYAQLGFDRTRILALFRNRFYAAAYAAACRLGEAGVERLVDEAVGVFGAQRYTVIG